MSKAGDRQKREPGSNRGRRFALLGLLVGLAAGFVSYLIVEYWYDAASQAPAPRAALAAIGSFAAALLLLAEAGALARAIAPATGIAAVLGLTTWSILSVGGSDPDLTPWPRAFWILAGMPLSGYLMTTLAKAAILDKVPPKYSAVFFHGLTVPIIAAGAEFFAMLSLVLIYAWAGLLKSLDVDFFHRLFQEPWFVLPFVGAVGGLAIALIRGLDSTLGGLRFVLLLLARILMPITAVFSLTFVAVLLMKGADQVFATPYPGAAMIALAFAGMLIFNGVYQNGEGEPPPAWLRIATIVSLLTFPVYAGLAAYAFWIRIGEYGLTPPRIIGLAVDALAALYIVVCAAGLLTEPNWTGKRWMPLVAPLNTLMAVVWVATLLLLASPALNMWAVSAASQEARLVERRVDAAKFDFGYLRFELGDYGRAALQRLSNIENHPQAAEIRVSAARALNAENRYYFDHPDEAAPSNRDVPTEAEPKSAIDDLPMNPGGEAQEDLQAPAADAPLSPPG